MESSSSSAAAAAGGEATEPSGLSSCPSFNCYSSNCLANLSPEAQEGHNLTDDDDYHDFEFVPVAGDVCGHGFVISSDQIGPVFPVFNRDLLLENGCGIDGRDSRGGSGGGGGGDVQSIRIPLLDLFMEEDHDPLSSEADDKLQGIPEGSYCVWTPRDSSQSSPSWCEKSNSTGSRLSRRWRFLDLLRRSNSDRKDSFVFLTPLSLSGSDAKQTKGRRNSIHGNSEAADERKGKSSASAMEVFYTRRKVAVKGGGNRRKSYLPYRQDLVGFFANVNSLGRTFPPFGRI